jgi:hypothetical protein
MTDKNPMAQALAEWLQLMICNQLQVWMHKHEVVNLLIQACAWALCMMVPHVRLYNPHEMIFGMDIIFWWKVKIDWQLLNQQWHLQLQAITNNERNIKLISITNKNKEISFSL